MGNPNGFVTLVCDDILGRVSGRFQITRYTVSYVDAEGNAILPDLEYESLQANEPIA